MPGRQFAVVVINFLPEPKRVFRHVHFLDVARKTTGVTGNPPKIPPATARQIFPLGETAFVLLPGGHDRATPRWDTSRGL